MPKVTPAHRAARRRQILDAARAVFAEKGFAQTSTGDIVAKSGLSTGAVYSYFPSKNDLVLAVCDDAIDTVFGSDTPGNLSELLDRVHHIDGGLAHARLVAQIWGEAAVSPQLAARVREQLAAGRAKASVLINDERAARGLPVDPDVTGSANALLALLSAYLLRLAVGDEEGSAGLHRAIRAIVEAP
jgi:TetR/AcrR family transcriptional regulator, transcriptional repressor of aconitase